MSGGKAIGARDRAVASGDALGWIVALGALANLAAISPVGERAAELSARIHDTQHGVLVAASIVLGAGVRDLIRARPWPRTARMLVTALAAAAITAGLVPFGPIQNERHVAFMLAGAGLGMVLRDALLTRSARRKSRLTPYAPEAYVPTLLGVWIETGIRQRGKDRVLVPPLTRYFRPGRILELGSGAGQTAVLLTELGWDVVASDYAAFFVDHLQSVGLSAVRVDATDIAASELGTFSTIFCQSITPLITSDVEVIARTYRSICASLEPDGRLVEIHAHAARHELRATMQLHVQQARLAGFQDVRAVRNQLLPSRAYRAPLTPFARVAESALGRHLGSRFVLTAERSD